LRHDNHTSLLKNAQTVQRIAYCARAHIRQQVRAQRQEHFTVADDDYPYCLEEPHEGAMGRMADEGE
jgi:hypothetical protein